MGLITLRNCSGGRKGEKASRLKRKRLQLKICFCNCCQVLTLFKVLGERFGGPYLYKKIKKNKKRKTC